MKALYAFKSRIDSQKNLINGYCTLFLINNGQWSGGGLPIDRSPWNTDQGSMMGLK